MIPKTCAIAATLLALTALPAYGAVSLPNETAWAAGTNWSYRAPFAGLSGAWVYVPNGYSRKVDHKRAAVFHLKGCGVSSFQVAQGSGWPEAAEAYGIVVIVPEVQAPVYPNPQATNVECYNYGYNSQPTPNSLDHKRIIAAASQIVSDPLLSIDPNQIYLAGLSAGATVAMQVACMAPELFSGIASAAGPGMGTSQSTAIYPPYLNSVRTKCEGYLAGSANSTTAAAKFKELVVALISDDNDLPAMNFSDQTVWDGDKLCPYLNGEHNEEGFATLLGVTQSGTSDLATGQGIGCPGGEAMQGAISSSPVKCLVKNATARTWAAHATHYQDAAGKTHLVRIEQDTLRHSWPAGAQGPGDVSVTPTRADLIAGSYITANGDFDINKLNAAPNGQVGVIYFNTMAMDYPMFVAQLWDDNNPRIVPNIAQTPPTLTASASYDSASTRLTVSGTATATAAGSTITAVGVAFQSATHAAAITPGATVTYSVEIPGALADGSYTAAVTATDSNGKTGSADARVTVSSGNQPPVIATHEHHETGATLTVTGTATDPNGNLQGVELAVDGGVAQPCAGTSAFTCTVTGLAPGDHTAALTARDAANATSNPVSFSFTIVPADPEIATYEHQEVGSTLIVTGTATDSDGDLQVVELAVDGAAAQPCAGTTTFSCTVTDLVSGDHTAVLIARDAANATSEPESFNFTIAPPQQCASAADCTAATSCQEAPTCVDETCVYANKAEKAACDDGSLCTTGDACSAGECVGKALSCTASDACHGAGTCDPTTGCSNPVLPDGTGCSDKNACTDGDLCMAGVCSPGAKVSCTPQGECQTATCDPFYGCTSPNKPDGTTCSKGACKAGACVASATAPPAEEESFLGCGVPGATAELLAPLLIAMMGLRRRRRSR
ncbi:MAG: hypothetical protein HY901_38235 [Deltaproteobacteria bacterium]|nr:hypothetical protein [Deltaproteobacteria bacterium]